MGAKLLKLGLRLTLQNHFDSAAPFFNKMYPMKPLGKTFVAQIGKPPHKRGYY